jgi:AcrR family transcriptional regulator
MAVQNAQGERTRARVLDAAARVIEERGATALSLNAVAVQAGVSKGTLLYHFPTKEALVDGVIDQYVDQFEQAVDAYARLHPGQHAWVRAYVAVGTALDERQRSRALFTALAVNHDVVSRLGPRLRTWQSRADEDAPGGRGLLVKLAVDGLLIADLTSCPPDVDALLATVDRVLAE